MAKVDSKPCSRCKQTLPATSFTADSRTSSGLQPRCKGCMAAAARERRHADPDGCNAYQRAYRRDNPDKGKVWYANARAKRADKMKATARAYYRRNSERAIEWVRQDRKKHPERTREWARAWQARRKALKAGGVGGAEQRLWMQAQKKICHWCATSCAKNFHVDHIVPLSKGGPHELSNLCIACPTCNLRKNAMDPIDWAHSIGKLL